MFIYLVIILALMGIAAMATHDHALKQSPRDRPAIERQMQQWAIAANAGMVALVWTLATFETGISPVDAIVIAAGAIAYAIVTIRTIAMNVRFVRAFRQRQALFPSAW